MSAFPSNVYTAEIFALITGETPHLALYTSNPTAADSGTEVSGGSYVRKPITFGAVTGGSISNTVAVTFTGVPTATITHFGVRDALSGGDLKVYGVLNSSVASISGDEILFSIGNIQISLAGS
jgi:hypothetical protein